MATSGPRRQKPRFGRPKRGTVRRFAPKIGAAADVLICPEFFKKCGHSAIISGQPHFGSNRGNSGPISATSGPRRQTPRFGRPKRGTVRGFAPKIAATADVLICPDFIRNPDFKKIRPSFPGDPVSDRIVVTGARFRRRLDRAGGSPVLDTQNGALSGDSRQKMAPQPTC